MIATCPKCGADLEALHELERGDLRIQYGGAIVLWKGKVVKLSQHERLMLLAIVRADGVPVRRHILAEAVGYEGDDPDNLAAVHMTRINRAFRVVDPSFDRIENVRGAGLRWRA